MQSGSYLHLILGSNIFSYFYARELPQAVLWNPEQCQAKKQGTSPNLAKQDSNFLFLKFCIKLVEIRI